MSKTVGLLLFLGSSMGMSFQSFPCRKKPTEHTGRVDRIWMVGRSILSYMRHPILKHGIRYYQDKARLLRTSMWMGTLLNYPSNSTVLLRRTANGQPDLLMYEYGQGRVIVTSMYSDFALKQNQAFSEEIALIRDIISWAKKPEQLPEIKPGESVSVSVSVTNNTTNDASSVKASHLQS